MAFLPSMSGLSILMCLSNLPGLVRALSRISALFVPAKTTMWSVSSKPSISTSSWFNVASFSSLDPIGPASLDFPIASISSTKIIHGAFFLAVAKRSLTLEAPTPTYISTNSEPDTDKNGTPASPAVALAKSVLPVPGGPDKMAPFGILAPSFSYF
ncbi:hypothetical protein OGAPHI_000477 [Ogataea philodendri]|uniref:Secreted protein n=1 Tax=Ogataea philodendri TaxID=1378263 RepID=A0A9P8TA59_9ASCO|nr:uncharacterized protein OGAPHI_000477 [Ogataea philodendri]KAH3671254.1 hypothetical protein OGAPHI_000477 [Ogataea philodendri]